VENALECAEFRLRRTDSSRWCFESLGNGGMCGAGLDRSAESDCQVNPEMALLNVLLSAFELGLPKQAKLRTSHF
jgi:hypothetical protein